MQKIFRIWFMVILILSIIASFIVGIESIIFGLFLIPLIIILSIIVIFGNYRK